MSSASSSYHIPTFLAAVLRRPGSVGAIVPSSPALAEVLAGVIPTDGRPSVVELGAGTGAVSAAIARRMPAAGRHLAVEIDRRMAEHLSRNHPDTTVLHGDAAELAALLATTDTPRADAVISALPWSIFDEDLQHRIMGQIADVLTLEGKFTTIAYRHATVLPGARRFRTLLGTYFGAVATTRTVWRNVPPAVAYVCTHPARKLVGA